MITFLSTEDASLIVNFLNNLVMRMKVTKNQLSQLLDLTSALFYSLHAPI